MNQVVFEILNKLLINLFELPLTKVQNRQELKFLVYNKIPLKQTKEIEH